MLTSSESSSSDSEEAEEKYSKQMERKAGLQLKKNLRDLFGDLVEQEVIFKRVEIDELSKEESCKSMLSANLSRRNIPSFISFKYNFSFNGST